MGTILFIIGLLCFLAVVGFILKLLLGKLGDDFVPNFVGKSMIILIAVIFVCFVIAIISSI